MNGSFGKVVINNECAVKSMMDVDCFPYFVREAASLKLLDNKICNVVHLNKIVEDQLYLQKHSCNLKEASDTLDLEPRDIYLICYKLLVVLHNLQIMGISHRDVKLENILCDIDTEVSKSYILDIFLCDFGLARYHNGSIPEHITGSVQTEFYRAPELLFNNKSEHIEYDINNIDIWSLGICMIYILKLDMLLPRIFTEDEYKLLYGSSSFPVKDDIFYQHDIDIEFIYVIKMMLTVDWKHRSSANVLLNLCFFDTYRIYNNKSIILNNDYINLYNAKRTAILIDCFNISKSKISYQEEYDKFMEVLPYYEFGNSESFRLADILYKILYGRIEISYADINEIAALAAMIYDSEIINYSKDRCQELLKHLDYDIMWAV